MNVAGILVLENSRVSVQAAATGKLEISDNQGAAGNNGDRRALALEVPPDPNLNFSPDMFPIEKIDSTSPALDDLASFFSETLRAEPVALPEVEYLSFSHFPHGSGHTLSYQGRPILYRTGDSKFSVLYAPSPCKPFNLHTFELKSGEEGHFKQVRIDDFSNSHGHVLFGPLDILCRQIFQDAAQRPITPLGLYRQFEALPVSQHQSPVQTLADLLNQVQGSAEQGKIPSLYAIEQLREVASRHKEDIAFSKLMLGSLEQTLRLTWHLSMRSQSGKPALEALGSILPIFKDHRDKGVATEAQTLMRRNTANLHKRRNVAIAAHVDSGKTTATENILFNCGRITTVGKVDSGNTHSDSQPEERERGISISASVVDATWNPRNGIVEATDLSVIDCPGHVEFMSEVLRGLRVSDGGLFLIDSAKGVEVQTRAVWAQAEKLNLPGIWVVNKCDKGSCDHAYSVESVIDLCPKALPIQIPVFSPGFQGYIDLVSMKMVAENHGEGHAKNGHHLTIGPIPPNLIPQATSDREILILHLMEVNPTIERYLEASKEIPESLLRLAIHEATIRSQLFPIIFSSSLKNIGVKGMLDAMVDYLPSPYEITIGQNEADSSNLRIPADPGAEICGLVFDHGLLEKGAREFALVRLYSGQLRSADTVVDTRTGRTHKIQRITRPFGQHHDTIDTLRPGEIGAVFGLSDTAPGDTLVPVGSQRVLKGVDIIKPVLQVVLRAKPISDQDKLKADLDRLARIDQSIKVAVDNHHIIVKALGLLQIEVLQAQLKRRYGITTERDIPEVHFNQTITTRNDHMVKKHDYGKVIADILLRIEPLPRGSGLQIVDDRMAYREEAKDLEWFPLQADETRAIERGIEGTAAYGLVPHVPLTDIRVTYLWARYRQEGNILECLARAASRALREACEKSGLTTLEPIMEVRVACKPNDITKLQSEFHAREGEVLKIKDVGGHKEAFFRVPLRRIFDLTEGLRKVLGGESSYDERFLEYAPLPAHIAEEVKARQIKIFGARQH